MRHFLAILWILTATAAFGAVGDVHIQQRDTETTFTTREIPANAGRALGFSSGGQLTALNLPSLYQPLDSDLTTWAGVTPGTGIAAALGINIGSAGAPVVFNGAGGTPTSLILTNATGLPASGLTVSGQTQGDILYFNGTTWVRLEAGISGYFLQTLGAGANPVWAEGGSGTGVTDGDKGDVVVSGSGTVWTVEGYQPLDSDLTSIAALTTTSFGRGLLDDTNAAAAWTSLDLDTYLGQGRNATLGDVFVENITFDSENIVFNSATGAITGATLTLTGESEAYDATGWNGDLSVPTKDLVRDAIEAVVAGGLTDGDKGDITVSSSGAVWNVDANAITLATDTTGNYVATIADSGASEITVSGSGSENAAVTLAIAASIARDAEVAAAYQPLDSDLTSIAALTTTSFGRGLLDDADATAGRSSLGVVIGTNVQAFDADLSTYAGITPSANVQSLLGAADYSAMRTQLSLVPGTNVQAFDSDLTTWAGVTPGSGVATFLATPSSANLRAAITDETGTGSLYFTGGALATPSSATLTNATGLPISTGVSGLGSGVATALATPSSANLATAITDETGSGTVLFGDQAVTTSSSVKFRNSSVELVAHSVAGATESFDPAYGYHTVVLDEPCTFSFGTWPAGPSTTRMLLLIAQNGTGGFGVTWPGSVVNPPEINEEASEATFVSLLSSDGGTTVYAESSYTGQATAETLTLTAETEAYDATGWNGDLSVPTKDAIRDKIESMGGGSGDVTAAAAFGTDHRVIRSDGTGKGVQASPLTLEDDGDLGGIDTLSAVDGTFSGTVSSGFLSTDEITLGSAGVTITQDGDGAITFTGTGNGSDEALTLNFDDTANTIVASSSTGVTLLDMGTIALDLDGGNTLVATASANDNDTSAASTAYVQTELTAYASDTVSFTNKTLDAAATGNVLKQKGYIYLTHPHLADGTGATIGTTATGITYGHATFSNSADQAANYVEYYIQVPEDIDTSVALRARLKFLLGNTDTAAHRHVLSSVSVADSAVPTSATLANAINLDLAGDGSGANGDVQTTAWTTLTSWNSALTAGQTWRIRLARDGDDGTNDASTVNSTELGLVIEYGITQ